MDRKLLWLLAITSMFSAGNVYYAQPLLGDLARDFGVSTAESSLIPVLTQCGYVVGLLFLSPLGDIMNKRRLILWLLIAEAVILLGAAVSSNFLFFQIIAFSLGISSILVQIVIPLVAGLSTVEERAKNLGLVVGTALVGILLSRASSGIIAASFGWRSVYYIAASLLTLLSAVLYFILPQQISATKTSYNKLILSLFTMVRDIPDLRRIAINGALLYASLSAFWASLIFFLESDSYHLGSMAAGAFGVIGAMGAASASSVGGFINRYGSQKVLRGCMLLMGLSFLIMGYFGATYVGLIAGVIILDVAAQAATVTNQNELYSLHASAQARLNTIYKVIYFIGGAAGSAASAIAWQKFGWIGVCYTGLAFVSAAALWERIAKLKLQSMPEQELT